MFPSVDEHPMKTQGQSSSLRALCDRIPRIVSQSMQKNSGKTTLKCEWTVTKLRNCARKNWDPYAVDKIATKCKRRPSQELREITAAPERKPAVTKFGQQTSRAHGDRLPPRWKATPSSLVSPAIHPSRPSITLSPGGLSRTSNEPNSNHFGQCQFPERAVCGPGDGDEYVGGDAAAGQSVQRRAAVGAVPAAAGDHEAEPVVRGQWSGVRVEGCVPGLADGRQHGVLQLHQFARRRLI
jgi:hypothetical protein